MRADKYRLRKKIPGRVRKTGFYSKTVAILRAALVVAGILLALAYIVILYHEGVFRENLVLSASGGMMICCFVAIGYIVYRYLKVMARRKDQDSNY